MQPLPVPINWDDLVPKWYSDFVQRLTHDQLFDLAAAADFLHNDKLLRLTCAKVASFIRDKTTEEIRTTFGLVNDFTPEEEAQARNENKWCEDVVEFNPPQKDEWGFDDT